MTSKMTFGVSYVKSDANLEGNFVSAAVLASQQAAAVTVINPYPTK